MSICADSFGQLDHVQTSWVCNCLRSKDFPKIISTLFLYFPKINSTVFVALD